MRTQVKYALAIGVPLLVFIVVLIVLLVPGHKGSRFVCRKDQECNQGKCKKGACSCDQGWGGAQCNVNLDLAKPLTGSTGKCSLQPVPCNSTADCRNACGATSTEFVCQQVTKDQNPFGKEGSFCLPAKPINQCAAVTTDPGHHIPGKWTWVGWDDVDAQAWSCLCEYPTFYPQDTTTGQCLKSEKLCEFGKWTYPCVRQEDGSCKDLTPAEVQALAGTHPLYNGQCSCKDVACTSDDQCVVGCVDGTCVSQRLGLNSQGLPTCVQDTCPSPLACSQENPCANGSPCVNGTCLSSTLACSKDSDCPSRVCENGVCNMGKWTIADFPPYTYGFCQCPSTCVMTSRGCQC
ncbi:MAG: hypothetical protein K0U52_12805 [Gammaproteobacteria bacterium]|nr:hypothetical protein [Gammaproteobacteria bacterium]